MTLEEQQRERAATLDRLATALRTRPLTARQIAEVFKCARPTAYVWVRALIARGEPVIEIKTPSKRTGPRAVAYSIRGA